MEVKDTPEFNKENNDLVNKYRELALKYPMEELSYAPGNTFSFPDWEVTEDESNWAHSFLSAGNNEQVLKVFERSLAYIGTRGLQLLRDKCSKEHRSIYEKIKKEITSESLLEFLRIEYQSLSLYFEEGLRKSRNVYNDFWNGENDELSSARETKTLVSNSFIQMNEFAQGNPSTLNELRKHIENEYKANLNTAEYNHNFIMENMGSMSKEFAESGAKEDNERLIFWSSLNSFVDNLVLEEQQKIPEAEKLGSGIKK